MMILFLVDGQRLVHSMVSLTSNAAGEDVVAAHSLAGISHRTVGMSDRQHPGGYVTAASLAGRRGGVAASRNGGATAIWSKCAAAATCDAGERQRLPRKNGRHWSAAKNSNRLLAGTGRLPRKNGNRDTAYS